MGADTERSVSLRPPAEGKEMMTSEKKLAKKRLSALELADKGVERGYGCQDVAFARRPPE